MLIFKELRIKELQLRQDKCCFDRYIIFINSGSFNTVFTNQLVSEAIFSAEKQPEREACHLFSSTAVVNNAWIYNSTPPYVFMA
jgi:hypothetical protein